jgi:hypothetical protein
MCCSSNGIVLEEPADGIRRPVREDGRLGGDTVSHHLRFFGPREVSIDGTDLPLFECANLCIVDVSSWGWEKIGVQVKGCGADGTPIALYARTVVLLEKGGTQPAKSTDQGR